MTLKTLKDAMINLIHKSVEFEESFVFERLQDYMDFSDGKATWTSNVRIRMLEIHEAIENEKFEQKRKIIDSLKEADSWENDFRIGAFRFAEDFFNILKEDLK